MTSEEMLAILEKEFANYNPEPILYTETPIKLDSTSFEDELLDSEKEDVLNLLLSIQ